MKVLILKLTMMEVDGVLLDPMWEAYANVDEILAEIEETYLTKPDEKERAKMKNIIPYHLKSIITMDVWTTRYSWTSGTDSCVHRS